MRIRNCVAGCLLMLAAVAPALSADAPPESGKLAEGYRRHHEQRADVIDRNLTVLREDPESIEAHFNLAGLFIQRLSTWRLAKHHCDQYLRLAPDGKHRSNIEDLSRMLDGRARRLPEGEGVVIEEFMDGRLLVTATEGAQIADQIKIDQESRGRVILEVEYVYPGCVLGIPIWPEKEGVRGPYDPLEPQFRPGQPDTDSHAG